MGKASTATPTGENRQKMERPRTSMDVHEASTVRPHGRSKPPTNGHRRTEQSHRPGSHPGRRNFPPDRPAVRDPKKCRRRSDVAAEFVRMLDLREPLAVARVTALYLPPVGLYHPSSPFRGKRYSQQGCL